MSDKRQTSTTHDDGVVVEPENSTVDDWLGQKVDRDRQLAEDLLAETGGDVEEAQRRFDEQREGPRPESLPTEERRT